MIAAASFLSPLLMRFRFAAAIRFRLRTFFAAAILIALPPLLFADTLFSALLLLLMSFLRYDFHAYALAAMRAFDERLFFIDITPSIVDTECPFFMLRAIRLRHIRCFSRYWRHFRRR